MIELGAEKIKAKDEGKVAEGGSESNKPTVTIPPLTPAAEQPTTTVTSPTPPQTPASPAILAAVAASTVDDLKAVHDAPDTPPVAGKSQKPAAKEAPKKDAPPKKKK